MSLPNGYAEVPFGKARPSLRAGCYVTSNSEQNCSSKYEHSLGVGGDDPAGVFDGDIISEQAHPDVRAHEFRGTTKRWPCREMVSSRYIPSVISASLFTFGVTKSFSLESYGTDQVLFAASVLQRVPQERASCPDAPRGSWLLPAALAVPSASSTLRFRGILFDTFPCQRYNARNRSGSVYGR